MLAARLPPKKCNSHLVTCFHQKEMSMDVKQIRYDMKHVETIYDSMIDLDLSIDSGKIAIRF